MISGVITIILTTTVIAILPIIIFSKSTQKVEDYKHERFKDTKFKVSKWLYAINSSVILVAILFWYGSYVLIIRIGISWFSIVLAMIGVLCCSLIIYGFYKYSNTYAMIEDGIFTYYNGRKITVEIRLRDIRQVYIFSGNITIDIGNKHREVVPMIFKDSSKLVAMLKYYKR